MNDERHTSHPSQRCECITCNLEYSCSCPDRSCDCAEYDVAVNPSTGAIVAFTVDHLDRPHVELVAHCQTTGRTLAHERMYPVWADAVEAFGRHADWQPTVAGWPAP